MNLNYIYTCYLYMVDMGSNEDIDNIYIYIILAMTQMLIKFIENVATILHLEKDIMIYVACEPCEGIVLFTC